MTILAYFRSTGVATTKEIIELKKEYPADYDLLMKWTREQMEHNGVEISEK